MRFKRWKIFSGIVAGCVAIFFVSIFIPLPEEDFRPGSVHSLRVTDRFDILLREYLNDQEGRGQWKELSDIAPSLQSATIAVEDRRFSYHPGIDPIAIARAIATNIATGRLVSGGSTITQQVIRNVYQDTRTMSNKALEAWYALRLERAMTKSEILEQYLNRVSYGNQCIGAEPAARYYFGKPARDLSLAESAFLAGLPNAPSTLNPYTNFKGAQERQQRVLRLMSNQQVISQEEFDRAIAQPILLVPSEINFRAPHFVEMVRKEVEPYRLVTFIRSTLDYSLQRSIQWLVKGHLNTLRSKNVGNAAVVVIDNHTMEIRALIGSADYFNVERSGQINGALALRQPGSSVKPFTYALAFEGGMSAAEILPDIPFHIPDDWGDFVPQNYDRRFHGPVRARTALACSYNIPAVRVAQRVGIDHLLQRMLEVGISSLTQPAKHYGIGLTLGNGEVTLFDLTKAYAAFANAGRWRPARFVKEIRLIDGDAINFPSESSRKVFDPEIAFIITDILKDPAARRPAFGHAFRFPFECAVKTGTTKDYRDNWTLGYTRDYTVGVWVGNFDGSPMRGVSGISGAGKIFYDVMMLLHTRPGSSYPEPFPILDEVDERMVCSLSGQIPSELCRKTLKEWFLRETSPRNICSIHQLYRVRNDLGEVTERVYEVLPPEFASWVYEEKLPVPPRGSVLLVKPSAVGNPKRHALSIVSPSDGQTFKLDPILRREFQSLKIVGLVPEQAAEVTVRINDEETMSYSPNGVWWSLKRGLHTIRLEGTIGRNRIESAPIRITVN